MERYISVSTQALFPQTRVNSTYHPYLPDRGCKRVDSCLFHQELYHYHRHSHRHHLAKKMKSVEVSKNHREGYRLAFFLL